MLFYHAGSRLHQLLKRYKMRFLVLVLLLTARTLTAEVLPDAAQTTKGA
jgi:hypothetical protein